MAQHRQRHARILDLMDADGIGRLCAAIGPLTGAVLNAGVTQVGRFLIRSFAHNFNEQSWQIIFVFSTLASLIEFSQEELSTAHCEACE